MSRDYAGLPYYQQQQLSSGSREANANYGVVAGDEEFETNRIRHCAPSHRDDSRPSSRRMIDSLAEELDQLYTRVKRTTSMQSGMGSRSDDEYTSSRTPASDCDYFNNRTPTHQPFGHRQRDLSICSDKISNRKRDHLLLHFLTGECTEDMDDEFEQRQMQFVVETPVSPTRALEIAGMDEKIGRDHQLYFDTEQTMESSQEILPSLRRVSTHVKPEEINFISSRKDDSSGFSSSTASEHTHPTHRVIHRFVPRHKEEVLLEIGDPVHVDYEGEDTWCNGTNLRTGQSGIFPMANVFEVDIDDDSGGPLNLLGAEFNLSQKEKATFLLTYLGSVEVAHHKGNDVLVQAISKVLQFYQKKEDKVVPHSVLLDISFRGIHMIDKSKKNWFRCPNFDYFYSLQNISFCGTHPKQVKYFGFITKHPLLPRFACHVFMSKCSTESVVEAIGRAFQKSYNEYMAFSHPTEDIFID